MPKDFLLIIGEREPLAWILTERKMAFPAHRSRDAGQLAKGDRLFLYTTRGCFHSPGRDRGRIIGEATVTSEIAMLEQPVEFGEQSFPTGCSLNITGLVPRDEGPEMNRCVDELHLFPSSNPKSWGVRLRRVLVPLDQHDARVLHTKLAPVMRPLADVRVGYLDKTRYALPARS
ncbi:MAG: hypothetical protein ACYCTI_01740 [Acidimicrobiales bacterium]